jgi:transglutaminase-like putative cysteine protease
MGNITSQQFTTKTGTAFHVRTALPDDAAQLMAFCQAVGGEAKYILTQSDEFTSNEEEERKWIQSHLDQPGQLALVAEASGCLVGLLSFENGQRRRNAHQGTLGMSVRENWQRMGVGTALLRCLLDWAEANPLIEKVGLAVFSDNLPAISLYRKFGFIEEGRQPRQIKLGSDAYQDLVLMYRYVGKQSEKVNTNDVGQMQLAAYLHASEFIDFDHPAIASKARELAAGCRADEDMAKRCFEFVRDEIKHSWDFRLNPVTCKASDVLIHGTGYCYAKSHLLAALLRANGIPAGLCYQRLSLDGNGPPFTLHGLNAVFLKQHGWYRIDARGNKPGVEATFCPPDEKLAFPITSRDEADLPEIWAEPLAVVVNALTQHNTVEQVYQNLPDIEILRLPGR